MAQNDPKQMWPLAFALPRHPPALAKVHLRLRPRCHFHLQKRNRLAPAQLPHEPFDCLVAATEAVFPHQVLINTLGTAEQTVTRYGFDENGNQLWSLDPTGVGTTNVFDELNQRSQVLFPDGTTQITLYDALGRRTAQVDAANITNWFGFDGLGRLTSVTNALGKVTRYKHDEAGNQTAQIDALDRTNHFGFDSLGRRVWHLMPDGTNVERFAYDAAANLRYHTNFNGVVITNQYDSMNRLTNRTSVNGYQISFAYSPTGQRTNMTDPSGTTAYLHDSRDRLTNKVVSWSGGLAVSLSYAHDANGNITNIWSDTPGGVNLQYGPDLLNRITNVLASGQMAARYAFDLNGNLKGVHYGNGVTNLLQFDSLNRLTNMFWKLNASPLASFYYQLGAAGNRTNLTETVNGTSRPYAWNYDPLYRLRTETISDLGAASYGLDAVGNRTNRLSTIANLPSNSLAYSNNDWLTTDAYDSNGNTLWSTNGQTAVGPYYYDVENRLTNFNNSVYLGYNGDGIRVAKSVNGTNFFYLVDDRNPSGYAQVLEEWTASGGATNLSRVYNWGLALISQSTLNPQPSTTFYFIPDGHGSTRLLVDENGAVTNVFSYDAYGTVIASNGTPATAFLYCGEQFDSDLAFYYLRARYYQPQLGRFWTMDSFEGRQQDPLSLHKYLYCQADPVNGIDPSGHFNLSEKLTVGLVITFLASSFLFNIATETPTAAIDLYSGREFDEVAREVRNAVALGVAIDVATLGGAKLFKAAKFLAKINSHGKAGEKFLSKMASGGKRQAYVTTTKGGRFIDYLVDGVAMESKQGRVSLEKKIRKQIEKDVELLKTPGSGVKKVEWHFFPGKGGFGPTEPLRKELERVGIEIIEHPDFL